VDCRNLRGFQLLFFAFLMPLMCAICLAHLTLVFVTFITSDKEIWCSILSQIYSSYFYRLLVWNLHAHWKEMKYVIRLINVFAIQFRKRLHIRTTEIHDIKKERTLFSQLTSSLQAVFFRPQCDKSSYVKVSCWHGRGGSTEMIDVPWCQGIEMKEDDLEHEHVLP
jgi:hypothetical protein